MYSKIDVSTTDGIRALDYYGDIIEDDDESVVKPIGDEIETQRMQPMLWFFPTGHTGNLHKHEKQEEFYHMIEGEMIVEVEDEAVTLRTGESLYVSPDSWRQTVVNKDSVVLIIGAPKVRADGIRPDEIEE